MVLTDFNGAGVGFGFGVGCGFGVGWGFGGMPLNFLGLGAGGGCGIGVGLGWGFGTAFGSKYRTSRVSFHGTEFGKRDQTDATFKDVSQSTQEARASQQLFILASLHNCETLIVKFCANVELFGHKLAL